MLKKVRHVKAGLLIVFIFCFLGCQVTKEKREGDYEEKASYEKVSEDENSSSDASLMKGKADVSAMKFSNGRAFLFRDTTYIFLGGNLWKINSQHQAEAIAACEAAAGCAKDAYLYWAVWKEGTLSILRIDEENQILESGRMERELPPSMLDVYYDIVYVKNENGKVEGYHLNESGNITEAASAEEMKLYEEENRAAESRMENSDHKDREQSFLEHVVPAGYSLEICGKEFFSRDTQQEEADGRQMIVRSNGQDTVLFTFYGEVVLDSGKLLYFADGDRKQLSVYDLTQETSEVFYEFKDGTFDFISVENQVLYGIWNSEEQSKSYFVSINMDMENAEITPYFITEGGWEYEFLNQMVYAVDAAAEELIIQPVTQFSKEDMPPMSMELAWKYLRDEYFAGRSREEISYEETGKIHIIMGEKRIPFSSEEEHRCQSEVRLDVKNSDDYIFEHYYVYYEDHGEVFAVKNMGVYYVDCYTGEITKFPDYTG